MTEEKDTCVYDLAFKIVVALIAVLGLHSVWNVSEDLSTLERSTQELTLSLAIDKRLLEHGLLKRPSQK